MAPARLGSRGLVRAVRIVAFLAVAANHSAGAAGGRVAVAPGLAPKAATIAALERLADAAERGDRAGFLAELAPSSRARAAPLAEALVSTAAAPRTDLRVEVVGLAARDSGHALVTARVPEAAVTRLPEAAVTGPAAGWTRPDPGRTTVPLAFRMVDERGRPWLWLEAEPPAEVVDAVVSVRIDREGEGPAARWRVSGTSRLALEARSTGVSVTCLSLPEGARARPLGTGATLTPLGKGDEPLVRLELASPIPPSAVAWIELEHEAEIPASLVKGSSLFFVTAAHVGPWAGRARHRYDVTVDAPDPLRAVSIGTRDELDAPRGRSRSRHDCRRDVDLTAVVVGPYRVERDGELELWRTRDVGGDAAVVLGELRRLVDYQASRVGPLPYGAFRLVELPVTEGLAMSFPSFILMTPGLLATREKRFEILSHEVAHQWWGNAVEGDASTRWISEGMAEALRDLTVRDLVGQEEFHARLADHRVKSLKALDAEARPLADERQGGGMAYDRGALAVHALREAVGEDAFWSILRAWYRELAGRRAGTDQLQAIAEREAGRPLGSVFDPWLRATALPVLSLEWAARERAGRAVLDVTIVQAEPAFELRVPVRVLGASGTRELEVHAAGPRHVQGFEQDEPLEDVQLDPDLRTPRVKDDEIREYLAREAAACIARGQRARGIELLERARAIAFLDTRESLLLAAALVLEGRADEGRAALDAELSLLPDHDTRRRALMEVVDSLLAASAPDAAEPLLARLEAEVDDGAAVPLRRAGLERLRGREAEARTAFELAARRRPRSAAALSALGRPAPGAEAASLPGEATVLPPPADGSGALLARPPLVAALGGALVAALEPHLRRLTIVAEDGEAHRVDHAPSGAVALAAAESSTSGPLLLVLEADARRSRLVVLEVPPEGAARVVARHGRCPPGATALTASEGTVHVGFADEATRGVAWHRFTAPLTRDSAGPDDGDGLLRLRVEDDSRFEPLRTAPWPSTVSGGVVTWQSAPGQAADSSGRRWDWSEQDAMSIVQLVPGPRGFAALLRGDLSRSPFAEDALPAAALVTIGAEGVTRLALPPDVVTVSLAPDGTLALVRDVDAADGRTGARVSVVRR